MTFGRSAALKAGTTTLAVLLVTPIAVVAASLTDRQGERTGEQVREPAGAERRFAQSEPFKTFHRYENFDLTSSPFRQIDLATYDECEQACSEASSCTAYTFDEWNRLCFLKDQAGDLLLNARSVSGVLEQEDQPSRSNRVVEVEIFRNRSFADTGYVARPAGSYKQCIAVCEADEYCFTFTHVSSKNECRMYERSGEYYPRKGYISGAKRQN